MKDDYLIVRVYDKLYFKTIIVTFLVGILIILMLKAFLITGIIVAIINIASRKEKYTFIQAVGNFIYTILFVTPLFTVTSTIWLFDAVSGTNLAAGLD